MFVKKLIQKYIHRKFTTESIIEQLVNLKLSFLHDAFAGLSKFEIQILKQILLLLAFLEELTYDPQVANANLFSRQVRLFIYCSSFRSVLQY
jgi:hypothetical protein